MVVDPSLFPFLVSSITEPVDTLTVRVYLDRRGGGGGILPLTLTFFYFEQNKYDSSEFYLGSVIFYGVSTSTEFDVTVATNL